MLLRKHTVNHIAPLLDDIKDAALQLISGYTEFSLTVELYTHFVEDRDYFNNMDFYYRESTDGWVGKVIEYRDCLAGYKKLSDIIA